MGMTIEEHIGVIEDLKSTMSVCMSEPEKTEICTSLSVAIDTMRQMEQKQRCLDKIRAEIAELSHYYPMGHDYQIAITRCLAVIDKYKAESEGRENENNN